MKCSFGECTLTTTTYFKTKTALLTGITTFRFHTIAALQPKKRKEFPPFAISGKKLF